MSEQFLNRKQLKQFFLKAIKEGKEICGLDDFIAHSEQIERRTYVGEAEFGSTAVEWLHRDGWHIAHIGSYTDAEMYPRRDITRFKLIAERSIKETK